MPFQKYFSAKKINLYYSENELRWVMIKKEVAMQVRTL